MATTTHPCQIRGVDLWSVDLDPGESIHFHYHPYVIIALGGEVNIVESIFGDKRETHEPTGTVVAGPRGYGPGRGEYRAPG